MGSGSSEEGITGSEENYLSVKLFDGELLALRDQYEGEHNGYFPKIKPRQKNNKTYLSGMQQANSRKVNGTQVPVSSNLLFEATATFVPAALAKNPEPVVWSDNTPEGKQASNDLKTMLQFHAETLGLREKLAVNVWHWGVYFLGCLKFGWDDEAVVKGYGRVGDVDMKVKNPKNLKLDPKGYVNEFGYFVGWLGDPIEVSAQRLIELFPKKEMYIKLKVSNKLGTPVTYTEWWTDEMCFSTFEDIVLDAHKNEFFNYPKEPEKNVDLSDMLGEEEPQEEVHNHFATPMKPYVFLSVFSLQEEPYDFTNLIEQNISNQDQIVARDLQIDKNARQSNNGLLVSGLSFNQETAHQAAEADRDGDAILVPDGNMDSVKRMPANALPNGLMDAQENNKNTLRSIYGVQGISATAPDTDQTAHGMVIDTNRDSSRIGGGIGDSLERVARAAFNYLTQLYYVFYDEAHYASIMGNGAAVSYVALQMQDQSRRFVVSVSPNSMAPKDELTQRNQAVQMAQEGFLDPLGLFEAIDDADPTDSAMKLMLYKLNPQQYIQQYLSPEQLPGGQAPPPPGGNAPPEQGNAPQSPSAPPASSSLSQAPLPSNTQPKI